MGALLGWGDGGLEGDMGLSQDGPIGPSQQANPQDSPPVAPRHPGPSNHPHRPRKPAENTVGIRRIS
jgi:hypothetical protein